MDARRYSSRVDCASGAQARRGAPEARGAGEPAEARSHGGFVASLAVRRRKGVSWRPCEARGLRDAVEKALRKHVAEAAATGGAASDSGSSAAKKRKR